MSSNVSIAKLLSRCMSIDGPSCILCSHMQAKYYQGGCVSPQSSAGSLPPTCSVQGECLQPYLEQVQGATTGSGFISYVAPTHISQGCLAPAGASCSVDADCFASQCLSQSGSACGGGRRRALSRGHGRRLFEQFRRLFGAPPATPQSQSCKVCTSTSTTSAGTRRRQLKSMGGARKNAKDDNDVKDGLLLARRG